MASGRFEWVIAGTQVLKICAPLPSLMRPFSLWSSSWAVDSLVGHWLHGVRSLAPTHPLGVDSHAMSFLPSVSVFFLLFLVNPLSSLIAKAPLREQSGSGEDPVIPQTVSTASPSSTPSPRLAEVTRFEAWIQDTGHSWGLMNHMGQAGL